MLLTNHLNVPSPSEEQSSPMSRNSSPYWVPGYMGSTRTDYTNLGTRLVSGPPQLFAFPLKVLKTAEVGKEDTL